MKVTLVQSALYWRDPGHNRSRLEELVRSTPPSDLYILPETFTTGFLGETRKTDEGMDGETVAWMRVLASELNAGLAGSVAIMTEKGRRNRFLFARPSGDLSVYDKRHLFSFAGEDRRYLPGEERVVFDYAGWRICPQICYDLRFPVWCRNRGDYDMLLLVANWPSRRVDAWDALVRARAIENQCFVVAVNRVGEDGNGLQFPGHSAIYDPLGRAVIPPWTDEGCKTASIELDRVASVRAELPFAAEADDFVLL
jgi:omega-amidase